jgi:hypothetical protein
MKVLVACEESQVVTKAFRARGHEAYSCDIIDCSGGFPEYHIKDDVLNHLNDGWDMMIAHPVCDRLTNAGVRWLHIPPPKRTFNEIWKELYESVEFYLKLRNANIDKKALENPIMHKYARAMIGLKHRQIVQPWWFGDRAFKATGFELFNLPELKPTNKLIPPKSGTKEHKTWSTIHRMTPSKNRKKLRSKTFPGIAQAMADQWG